MLSIYWRYFGRGCTVVFLKPSANFKLRTNEPGAFWGLMVGLVIGLIRFGLEFSTSVPACGDYTSAQPPQWWQDIVGQIHYLHFGLILWAISGLVTIAVSLITPPPPPDSLHRYEGLLFVCAICSPSHLPIRLTYWSRHSTQVRAELPGEGNVSSPSSSKKKRNESWIIGHLHKKEMFQP